MKRIILLLILSLSSWAQPSIESIVVMQAKDGKILYSQNASTPMTPASTTKLLTVYTALKDLGPGFTFKTQILKQDNHLYLRFVGDPSLSSQNLQDLLKKALSQGEFKGDLVIDASAFAAPWVARGWSVEDTPWYFAAPVHAVILNENSIPLTLSPPKQVGELVSITSQDPSIKLHSRVKGVAAETAESLCQLDLSLPAPQEVIFEGCWPVDTPPLTLKVANRFPLETAQQLIQLQFKGKIKTGITPKGATLVAEHPSAPLSELINAILQDSNNLYAESFTKTLGGKFYQRPTFQAGSFHIENTLKKDLKISADELTITDGSGNSRQNLISAKVLANLLQAAYSDPSINKEFINALSTSGVNGKLKQRLTNLQPPFVGKTGSMSHVSTLAGYHDLEGDNPLIYVIMVNNSTQKASEIRQELDKKLEYLVKSVKL